MLISGITSLILVLTNVLNNFNSLCCFYSVVTSSGFPKSFQPITARVWAIRSWVCSWLEQRQCSLLSLIWTAWQMSDKNNLNQARTLRMVACHALNYFVARLRVLAILCWIENCFPVELKISSSNYHFCPWTATHCFLRARFNWNYFYRSLVVMFKSRNLNPITSQSKSSVPKAKNWTWFVRST